jgi:hypothetical protein
VTRLDKLHISQKRSLELLLAMLKVKAAILSSNNQSSLGDLNSELNSQLGSKVSSNYINMIRNASNSEHCHSFTYREAFFREFLQSLTDLQHFVTEFPQIASAVSKLANFLESMKDPITSGNTIARHQRLEPLREMLFWFPSLYIPNLSVHPSVMLLMAHLHAVARFIDPVTDGNSADFRSLNIAPIQAFHEELCMRAEIEVESGQNLYARALTLMEFPLGAVAAFHCLHGYGNHGSPEISLEKSDFLEGATRRYERISMLQILENFPVGLWHNSLS